MTLEELIAHHQKSFGDLDRSIVSYLLANQNSLVQMSITELADRTYTSKSTVLRLVKKLGFSGYSEFKYYLRSLTKQTVKARVRAEEMQRIVIQKTVHLMESTDWDPVLEAIYNAQMIYVFGTGFSQRRVLDEFSKNLMQLGKKVIAIPNTTEFDLMMPLLTDADLVIVASLSGETPLVLDKLLLLELRNIPTISVTRTGSNSFARHTDIALHYHTEVLEMRSGKRIDSMLSLSIAMDYMYRQYIDYVDERMDQE